MHASVATPFLPSFGRLIPAVVIGIAAIFASSHLQGLTGGRELVLSLWFGLAFGIFLQRSRFCFYCLSRDFIEKRDARGPLGILACLAVGTLGYHLLFGAFLPDPAPGRLPPGAHIAPVSWVLAAGATAFGLGMALAGSCISAHFYRLGEGALGSLIALPGAALGFVLGFMSWNRLYLNHMQQAPTWWLPHHLGYGGSLALQLALLGGVALLLACKHRTPAENPASQAWYQKRWPAHVGGILIGSLAVITFLRVSPLGVTAELGSLARTAADHANLLPVRLEGLDMLRGCATVIKETLWSNNGLFVVGLVGGSFAAAWSAGDVTLKIPGKNEAVRLFAGGILMGWGAMVALGCTVGTLLSGIMAAAVSGWVFAIFCVLGLYAGWRIRRRFL